jgi:hypothetical protein
MTTSFAELIAGIKVPTQYKKRDWEKVLETMTFPTHTTRTTFRADDIGPENDLKSTYWVGTKIQRMLKEGHIRALVRSFRLCATMPTTILTYSRPGHPHIRFVLDGQHRLVALKVLGLTLELDELYLGEATPRQVWAVLKLLEIRKNINIANQMQMYRTNSPVWDAVVVQKKWEAPIPLTFNRTKSGVEFSRALEGWRRAFRMNIKELGEDYSGGRVKETLAHWQCSIDGPLAVTDLDRLISAMTASWLLMKSSRSSSDVGTMVVTRFRDNPSTQMVVSRRRLLKEYAASKPSRKLDMSTFQTHLLFTLFVLIRFHGWDKVLYRLPFMLAELNLGQMKKVTNGTSGDFHRKVLAAVNHTAKASALTWPSFTDNPAVSKKKLPKVITTPEVYVPKAPETEAPEQMLAAA